MPSPLSWALTLPTTELTGRISCLGICGLLWFLPAVAVLPLLLFIEPVSAMLETLSMSRNACGLTAQGLMLNRNLAPEVHDMIAFSTALAGIVDRVDEFGQWLMGLDRSFAFLLALPFMVALAGLSRELCGSAA